MGSSQLDKPCDPPLIRLESDGSFVGEVCYVSAKRCLLPVGEAPRPILDRVDELILAFLHALFGRRRQLFSRLFEPLFDSLLDEYDLIVPEGGHDRRGFVDDGAGNGVDEAVDLALHSEELLLGEPLGDGHVDRGDQHVDLAAQGRGRGSHEPVDRSTRSRRLRFVEIELDGNLTRHPASAEVLKQAGAADREQQEQTQGNDGGTPGMAGEKSHGRKPDSEPNPGTLGPEH